MRHDQDSYGWIVLGAAALITCVGMGALFSLAIFLKPIEDSMGWSRAGISAVALLNWIAMGAGSLLWGALSDRVGTRAVALAGGALLGLGLVLSSRVDALWQLQLTFGVIVGLAVGAFYAPLTSTAAKWFPANRGLAVGIVSSGIGLGVLIVSPLVRRLTTLFDWQTAMLLLGVLAWLVIVPAGLLIRERPDTVGTPLPRAARPVPREFSPREVARAPEFWLIALTHLACCTAHSGPIFHMVTYAIDQGVGAMTAATVLSASGLSSIAGRIGCGMLADRFGAKPTLVAGLGLQAVMIFLYAFAAEPSTFYALALIFGVAYGGVMPLYALVTREYFGERVMGTAYGGVFLVSTLGMGLGSWVGGLVHDHLGAYTWLYLVSAAAGVMAVMLAATFRPPRPIGAPPVAVTAH